MISVVMPARNAQATVKLAVISTLQALGPRDELLLGLHDSEDSTAGILNTIGDPRLRVVSLNGISFSEALNSLVKLSKGKYLARMDADDVCLPWRFKVQTKHLHDRSGIFLFSSVLVAGATRPRWLPLPQHPIRLNDRVNRQLLEHVNPLNHPTFFALRSTFDALGGYRNLAGEDLDLWLRAAIAGVSLVRTALPTVVYRVSPNQLSKESWYAEGWKTSPEIHSLRTKLAEQNASEKIGLTASERFAVGAVRLGLPTPRKLLNLKRGQTEEPNGGSQ